MLWKLGEPRWDFMWAALRKSLRTPDCRQGPQEKRIAIFVVVVVGGGGGGGGGGGKGDERMIGWWQCDGETQRIFELLTR